MIKRVSKSLAIFLTVAASTLLLMSCSSSIDSNRPQDFSQIPTTSIDSLQPVIHGQDAMISSITALETAPNGHIMILDADQSKVLQFHPNGERYNTFGRSGKGPGEMVAPRFMDIQDSTIRVLDLGTLRINRYNLTGDVIDNFDVQKEASYFGFMAMGDSTEYYTVANGIDGKLVGHRNAATDSVAYFGKAMVKDPPPTTDQKAFKKDVSNGQTPRAISNDLVMDYANEHLYVFLKSHSRLQKYDNGELLWEVPINHPANEPIFEKFTDDVQSGPSAFGILRYIGDMTATQNHVYLLWNRTPERPQSVVKVSSNGTIKKVIELPMEVSGSLSDIAVDTDKNQLYLGDFSSTHVYGLSLDA